MKKMTEMNKRYNTKKDILRDECFETLKSFTVKELLILNLVKEKDLNYSFELKILLRKIKSFKEMK